MDLNTKTLSGFGSIADGAEWLNSWDRCLMVYSHIITESKDNKPPVFSIEYRVGGFAMHPTLWAVYVKTASC